MSSEEANISEDFSNKNITESFSFGKLTTFYLADPYGGEHNKSPRSILSDFIRDNWTLSELPRTKIYWNSWYSGSNYITVKFLERSNIITSHDDQFTTRNRVYSDVYGNYHDYETTIDMIWFIKQSFTVENEIVPEEIDHIVTYMKDFIKDKRHSLQDKGIMELSHVNSKVDIEDTERRVFRLTISIMLKRVVVDK